MIDPTSIQNTLVQALGIEFLLLNKDCIRARMPVDERTKQPYGLLHGGASAALIETLASVGSAVNLEGAAARAVGTELNISHLSSARDGWVIGEAVPLRLGASLHVWQVEVRRCMSDEAVGSLPESSGSLISVGRCSLFVKKG